MGPGIFLHLLDKIFKEHHIAATSDKQQADWHTHMHFDNFTKKISKQRKTYSFSQRPRKCTWAWTSDSRSSIVNTTCWAASRSGGPARWPNSRDIPGFSQIQTNTKSKYLLPRIEQGYVKSYLCTNYALYEDNWYVQKDFTRTYDNNNTNDNDNDNNNM